MNLDKDGEPGRASQIQQELVRAGHVGRKLDTGSEHDGGIGMRDSAVSRQNRHAPRPRGLHRRCWVVKSDSREGPGYS